ncbi:alpha/beta-hydrolase [Trametes meyenii]|nr:alpha/beta-hydrolase [Trametes meyenii]
MLLTTPSRLCILFFASTYTACAGLSSASIAKQAVSALPLDRLSSFKPYTHYANAAYCPPATTLSWTCGSNCDSNPSFIPVASGGDGTFTRSWFVGYDPILDEVIVSHQGVDIDKIMPYLTDANIMLSPLNSALFPGLKAPILVHDGFAETHSRSAPYVLDAVRTALSRFRASSVTITGHSFGAAVGLLDAVYLPLHIPRVTFRYVGYGLPRVGNWAFANYVNSQLVSVTHIANKGDPVPVLPPAALGFRHPDGGMHIRDSGEWISCADSKTAEQCVVDDSDASHLMFDQTHHDGPFDGIEMGC